VAERGLVLWLVERRRGLSLVVLLGKMSAAWLKNTMKMLVCKSEVTEFIKSSKRGNKAFIVHRGYNRAGWYLEVAEYAVGGCRGLIIISEGPKGQGWKILRLSWER
jgi:hypothetical protein